MSLSLSGEEDEDQRADTEAARARAQHGKGNQTEPKVPQTPRKIVRTVKWHFSTKKNREMQAFSFLPWALVKAGKNFAKTFCTFDH